MSTKRISVDEVLSAYKATGLKPLRGKTNAADGCCAIGVLGAMAGVSISRTLWACEQYGDDYTFGLAAGFDGDPADNNNSNKRERYDQGYADGQAAAAAVFGGTK